ncbi:MAG TPA: hypothetical protein VFS43_34250 [Polyangiaceae bacterium]|nr:hypothetical protein [Polyangiaceae bacterium]
MVLPPSAPLPSSLPSLTPSGGAATPYRPQRTALPPPRPPTPQGQPRAELRYPADAGVVPPPTFVPGVATVPSALGPERGALPAPPTAQAQRPPQPLPPPPAKAQKPLVRPNDLPEAWHSADDDELPTRFYNPKRNHPTRARTAKMPKKEQ